MLQIQWFFEKKWEYEKFKKIQKDCKIAKFVYIFQLGGKMYISMPEISPFLFFL
jgi:hypothetical protein